jgi:hypothetical protein
MITRGVVFGLVYVGLLVVVVALSAHYTWQPSTEDGRKTFLATVTVGSTAVTALMSSLLSIFNFRTMERIKATLPRTLEAHHVLFGAAAKYYDAVSRLQTGHFESPRAEEAEAAMKNAEGSTIFVPERHKKIWVRFWQKCRFLKETVENSPHDSAAQRSLWSTHAKELGRLKEALDKSSRQTVNP